MGDISKHVCWKLVNRFLMCAIFNDTFNYTDCILSNVRINGETEMILKGKS
jgi:hypothetical protein